MRSILGVFLVLAATAVAFAQDAPKLQLVVTFPNFQFYDAIEKGARAKADELGVELVVSRPRFLEYPNNFILELRKGLDQGVDGFAITPVSGKAEGLAEVVDKLIAPNKPVTFVLNHGPNEGVGFIGTDNRAAGAGVGAFLCDKLQTGEVGIVFGDYNGHADRALGASEALAACGMTTTQEEVAADLDAYLRAHAGVKAIFATDDDTALKILDAKQRNGRLFNEIEVVGFGAIPAALESIRAGGLLATVAENPAHMGELAVEVLAARHGGAEVVALTDSGTTLVTAENAGEFHY